MVKDSNLTQFTKFSGCGAKLGPELLDRALCNLVQPAFPELLVDYRSADDAGIWKINDDTALVQTVDFFPPIVDDSFSFGRIAAANALSDVYAMGGRPITALSIVAFPADSMDVAILGRIMEGALDALAEAGAALVGGHSINDDELKFGLAVTGLVKPDRVLLNNTPKPGDRLILTKPIGTGCINRALKAGLAQDDAVETATRSMTGLNKISSELLQRFSVNACTDISGFGLLGHLCEMIVDSGCGIRLNVQKVPTLPMAKDYVAQGLVPGGTARNRGFRERWIRDAAAQDDQTLNLLFDPQTSGGLAASVPGDRCGDLLDALVSAGIPAAEIGEVKAGDEEIELV